MASDEIGPLQRIVVVGCSGSGKTTTARRLSSQLGLPHIELDAQYHLENWQVAPIEQFRARVAALTEGPAWVTDGNYLSRIQDIVWPAAQVIVWLDLPRFVVMRSLVHRSFWRGLRGTALWNGNRERLSTLFNPDPEQNLVRYAWRKFPEYRRRYAEAAADPRWAHLRFVRIRSRRQLELWLSALPGAER